MISGWTIVLDVAVLMALLGGAALSGAMLAWALAAQRRFEADPGPSADASDPSGAQAERSAFDQALARALKAHSRRQSAQRSPAYRPAPGHPGQRRASGPSIVHTRAARTLEEALDAIRKRRGHEHIVVASEIEEIRLLAPPAPALATAQ